MPARPPTTLWPALTLAVAVALVGSSNAQPEPAPYSRQSDVIYGRVFERELMMEVLKPARPNGFAVIWVVSSNGVSNRGQTMSPSFERRVAPFIEDGYTVFAVIHRSSPEFQVPDYVQDARHAVRFIRHHAGKFGIDGQRIGIAGSSSGGAIALIVAMAGEDGARVAGDPIERESSRVQAAGCFFPPTDFMNAGESSQNVVDWMRQQSGRVDASFQFHDVDAQTGARTLITDRDRVLAVLRDMSPVTHVTADDPPTILIHGDADKAVPLRQSRLLVDRLNQVKVPNRLVVREGMGHAWPGWEADSALIAEWFDNHLHRVR